MCLWMGACGWGTEVGGGWAPKWYSAEGDVPLVCFLGGPRPMLVCPVWHEDAGYIEVGHP